MPLVPMEWARRGAYVRVEGDEVTSSYAAEKPTDATAAAAAAATAAASTVAAAAAGSAVATVD